MRPCPETYADSIQRLFPELCAAGRTVRTVTLQVTEDCNLRCSYCYQINKQHDRITFETAREFLTLLLDDKVPGFTTETTAGLALEFIGGEPFMEIGLIDRVCGWLLEELLRRGHPWKYFVRFSFSTNGVLYFTPEVQAFLRRYQPWISLSVSVDGDRTLHDRCRVFPDGSGSYDMAVAAAKDWMRRSGDASTKATLSPENIGYTARAVESLIEVGYRYIHINCVYEEGWTLKHARILYQQMGKLNDWLFDTGLHEDVYIRLYDEDLFRPLPDTETQNFCGGTGEMLAVDWRGELYPCLRYMPSSLGDVKPLTIGRIRGGQVEQTEAERRCLHCLKQVTRASQSTKECMECPIAAGCSWCSAYNYQCGDVDRRQTFICWMHKARALANYEFWSRYYRETGSGKKAVCYLKPEWIAALKEGM